MARSPSTRDGATIHRGRSSGCAPRWPPWPWPRGSTSNRAAWCSNSARRGVDKGTTLRTYAAELGAAAVAYTGDDLGDLPAFDAIDALRADGVPGLKIASGSAEVVEVARRADLILDGPAGVADFFDAVAARL